MTSQRPVRKPVCTLVFLAALCGILPSSTDLLLKASAQVNARSTDSVLDFDFFKRRVEPIFLKHRFGHARCYMCHSPEGSELTSAPIFFEDLPKGSTFWTDQQSHLNFQRVAKFTIPGNPASSQLLMYPLAVEQGGGGKALVPRCGRQFESENDPDWRTIAAWIRGSKAAGSLRK